MPKLFQYRSGSLIYLEGDEADKIFLLKSGKVSLIYQNVEKGTDIREQVQVGEFFGAKSALGNHPREENAITMADNTIVTALTVDEFEKFVMKNTRVVIKMLKVFSAQMRKIYKEESRLMEQEELEADEGLFNLGEHYLKQKRFSHAKYVFNSYLTYYPSGKYADKAVQNLEAAGHSLEQFGDSDETGAAVKDPAKIYNEAMNMVSQGRYKSAFTSFKSIVDMAKGSELAEKSSFEMGHCIFLLRKYEECLKYFITMLAEQPHHPAITEIMFLMGQCNEKTGNKEKAAAFYKKILSMNPDTSDETIAETKQALDALGVK